MGATARIVPIILAAIVGAGIPTATAGAQSSADRQWLAKWLGAGDKDAKKLRRTTPGGRNVSIARLRKLLEAGPALEKKNPGLHHGVTFEAAGETWKYTISIPTGYSTKKRYPVLIDTGHISMKNADEKTVGGALQNYVRQVDGDVIGVRPRILDKLARDNDGRYWKNADSVTAAIPAFRGLLRDVRRRYAVDPDRIYLTGISASGFWAWRAGAPLCGELAGIIPLSAVTHQVRFGWPNYRNVSVAILHARDDPTCKFHFAQEAHDELKKLGGPVETIFLDGGGHMAPFRKVGGGWTLAAKHARPRAPHEVSFYWQRIAECGPVYWLDVQPKKERPFDRAKASGHVTAKVDRAKNTIDIESEHVKRLDVYLSDDLVDLKKKVRIRVDGRVVHNRVVKPRAETLLDVVRRRADPSARFVAVVRIKPR